MGADNSIVLTRDAQAQSDTTTYTDGTRTGTLETMPNGTQRIRLRPAKVGNPMDGTTAMSARWKPTSEPMESARDTSSEPFYSALERTIEQKMRERASADQVKGIIRETKQEERDWLGIDQYLAENPRVSKADLLAVSYTHLDVYKRQILCWLKRSLPVRQARGHQVLSQARSG